MTQTAIDEFNVVVLNMHIESTDDLELGGQLLLLRARSRDVPFVVIIDAEHDRLGASLLWRFDVRGYILNSLNPATLAAAVKLICAGGPYQPMPPPALSHDFILANVETSLPTRPGPAPGPAPGSAQVFTSRETEVLRLLRQAKPNKVIAHELGISVNTAKVHVRNIMRKLRATNRTQVVVGMAPENRISMQ